MVEHAMICMLNFNRDGRAKVNMMSRNLIKNHLMETINVFRIYKNIAIERLTHIFSLTSHMMIKRL